MALQQEQEDDHNTLQCATDEICRMHCFRVGAVGVEQDKPVDRSAIGH